jgi:hypothetical protein
MKTIILIAALLLPFSANAGYLLNGQCYDNQADGIHAFEVPYPLIFEAKAIAIKSISFDPATGTLSVQFISVDLMSGAVTVGAVLSMKLAPC